MLALVHDLPNLGDIRRNPRRRLVLHDAHRLDGVSSIGHQRFSHLLLVRTPTPALLYHACIEPQPLHHVDPKVGEDAVPEGQDRVAGREGIRQGGLPAPGPGAGVDERRPFLRLEEKLGVLETRFEKLGEPRVPVVLAGDHHGALDALVNVHGACAGALGAR